jgi:Phosphoheptose isomerase
MNTLDTVKAQIAESVRVKQALLADETLMDKIAQVAKVIVDAYKAGHKTLWAGNGGSAADAQHMAGNW